MAKRSVTAAEIARLTFRTRSLSFKDVLSFIESGSARFRQLRRRGVKRLRPNGAS
jgi:hypothetical protein